MVPFLAHSVYNLSIGQLLQRYRKNSVAYSHRLYFLTHSYAVG